MTRRASHSCQTGQRLRVQQGRRPGEEVRGADHDLLPLVRRRCRRRRTRCPAAGRARVASLGGLQVVGLLRIPQRDVVPVVRGQGRFQVHHPAGGTRRVGDAGQAEHGPHVLAVGLRPSGRTSLRGNRTRPGRPEPALAGVEQDPVRVAGVRGGIDVEKAGHVGAEQPARPAPRARATVAVAKTSASRPPDRVHALGLHGGLVHEAVVEIADLPLDARGLRALGRRLPR